MSELAAASMTVNSAVAQGAGNVLLVSANGDGHNLIINGSVTTGSGNIFAAADDTFSFTATGAVGGGGFSGTVTMHANRDKGNGANFTMVAGSSIETSNTTAAAVYIDGNSTTGTLGGALTVGDITVGDGGTITVTAAGLYDTIAQVSGTTLDAGPTGTVVLRAKVSPTLADAVGTSTASIETAAGNIVATASDGNIYVNNNQAGSFTASTTTGGAITLSTSAGVLTVGGPINTAGSGAIYLAGADGVTISAPLGSATTGPIAINDANDVIFASSQTFTSNDPVSITSNNPAEIQSPAIITMNGGTLTSPSGLQVDNGATLAGAGAIDNDVTADGTVAPSASATGLNNYDLALNADATFQVALNGTASGEFSVDNTLAELDIDSANLVIDVALPCRWAIRSRS